jgi:hypothetical protein
MQDYTVQGNVDLLLDDTENVDDKTGKSTLLQLK